MNSKVSEKAIWEGTITPDNETPSWASQMQSQPQMMFCYKCNNVIPNGSNYCPYCQVKLFVECPKCGVKYSSQYPACSQCGTNREEFLRLQRQEQERKNAIERKRLEEERRIREEKEKIERLEKIRKCEQEEIAKKKRTAYEAQNSDIIKTKDYESTYSLLAEILERYKNRCYNKKIAIIISPIVILILLSFLIEDTPSFSDIIIILLGFSPFVAIAVVFVDSTEKQEKFIKKNIANKYGYDQDMLDYVIKKICSQNYSIDSVLSNLSQWCIEAYRIKNGLPLNYN